MKNLSKFIFTSIGLSLICLSATAHDIYIWPDYFTINSEKPTSVAVDITASHTTFRSDFPMPSTGVKIFGVDGKEIRRRGTYFEGARRSSFDLNVAEQGTYLLNYISHPSYFTTYKIGRSDEDKFMRANKKQAKQKVPKKAKDVTTKRYDTIASVFLTNKAPTNTVLEPKKEGFEVLPVTHPADFVSGEEIIISFLFNGNPVKDLDVIIEQEGPQYREKPLVLELKSDAAGKIAFTLKEGGRFMLKANHERKSDDKLADRIVSRAYYAFEVIYE